MSSFLISFLSGALHIEGTVFQCERLRLLCLSGKLVLGSMTYTSGLPQGNYRKPYKGISLLPVVGEAEQKSCSFLLVLYFGLPYLLSLT